MPTKRMIDNLTNEEDLASSTKKHENLVTQLEISLLIYILKKFSHKDNPLYASKVAQYMSLLTGKIHDTRTLKRKLDSLCQMQDNDAQILVYHALFLTYGGQVLAVTNKDNPRSKTVHARYYFQPLLDASDVALICGAITSNRYLTPQEKKYLLTRQQTLAICDNTLQNIEAVENTSFEPQQLPPKPVTDKKQLQNLLHLVNQLYDAIENRYQIQIIYGIYDADPNNFRKIHFHARNEKKPYVINPYALLWCNGAYYLLATHNGHDNPVHFRVDRIMLVKPQPCQEDATKNQRRAPLPQALKQFFSYNGTELDVERYTATYPLMGIYDEPHKETCTLECTANTLSILIDHFGKNLLIKPSPLPHKEDELDFHGNKQQFLAVQIKNVQYDNILQFCLQQHTSITALSPQRLVEDIQKGLAHTLQKYQKMIDGTNS